MDSKINTLDVVTLRVTKATQPHHGENTEQRGELMQVFQRQFSPEMAITPTFQAPKQT